MVELLLVNEARKFQPYSFHLHCNPVRIVAAGSFNSTLTVKKLKDMYYNGSIKKNLKAPAFKSTFVLPAHGYTIVRFKASNPGKITKINCNKEFISFVRRILAFPK